MGEPNFGGHGLNFLTNKQLSFIVFFQKTKNSKLLNSTLSFLCMKKEKEKNDFNQNIHLGPPDEAGCNLFFVDTLKCQINGGVMNRGAGKNSENY